MNAKRKPAPVAPANWAGSNGKLLRLEEVRALTRRSRTRIYADMAEGRFPRPIRIGVRAVAWRERDLEAWLAERMAEREKAA